MADEPPGGSHYGQRILDMVNAMNTPRIGILLRHSVRDHIPKDMVGDGSDEVRLTDLGHSEAKRFGRLLPRGYKLLVNYSPVPRCRETAMDISAGYSDASAAEVLDAGQDNSLAVMHFFTTDRQAMDAYKRGVGGKRFMREWLDGTLPPGLIKPAPEVRRFVVQNVEQGLKLDSAPLLRIWVGHDYGLIVIRELIFGGKFENLPWVSFLDGLVFALDKEESLTAAWDGGSARVMSDASSPLPR